MSTRKMLHVKLFSFATNVRNGYKGLEEKNMDIEKQLDEMIVAAVESAHQDSLSDSEQVALVGRARKHMLESALRWLDSEERRGSDYNEVICALCYYAGGVVAKVAVSLRDSAPTEKETPNNEKLIEIFKEALSSESITALETIYNRNKNR
jgi:hypothetical protein